MPASNRPNRTGPGTTSWRSPRSSQPGKTKPRSTNSVCPGSTFALHPWYLTNGTYPVTDDYAHSNLKDPKMVEAAQFIHDLVHVHGVSPDPIGLNVYDQFAAGKFAMTAAVRGR